MTFQSRSQGVRSADELEGLQLLRNLPLGQELQDINPSTEARSQERLVD